MATAEAGLLNWSLLVMTSQVDNNIQAARDKLLDRAQEILKEP